MLAFFLLGLRIRRARVIKCNRFPRQKGGHGPRRSMRKLRKLGSKTRHCSLAEFGALGRKLWQVSRLICSSGIQRCRSFSERVGPRVIFLKASQVSSCSKRSREITTLTEFTFVFCCHILLDFTGKTAAYKSCVTL